MDDSDDAKYAGLDRLRFLDIANLEHVRLWPVVLQPDTHHFLQFPALWCHLVHLLFLHGTDYACRLLLRG